MRNMINHCGVHSDIVFPRCFDLNSPHDTQGEPHYVCVASERGAAQISWTIIALLSRAVFCSS